MTEGGGEPGGKRWWRWIAVWTLLGLIIRLGTVIGRPHRVAGGDAYFYHNAANLLVAGKGFIDPLLYYKLDPHRVVQSASFPPGSCSSWPRPPLSGSRASSPIESGVA